MTVLLAAVAAFVRGPEVVGPILQAALMITCANAVLAALAVLFSSLSTPVLSITYTLGLYATGYWTNDLRAFSDQMPGALGFVVKGASYVIPNLELFNLRSQVSHVESAGLVHLALGLGYAAAYAAAVLSLSVLAFERRELK